MLIFGCYVILSIFLLDTVNCDDPSWQGFVDLTLVGSGKLDQAAIAGFDGSIWAKSDGFVATQHEIIDIHRGFSDQGFIRGNGVILNGQKYLVIKVDDRSIHGRKGPTGVICAKTRQSIIIGTYSSAQQQSLAALTVEQFADYQRDEGY